MNHLSIFVILFTLSTIYADERTVGLLATPDPIRLPSIVPGEGPVSNLGSSDVIKPESLFDKLTAPLSLLASSFPCLGQASLKPGKCMSFASCSADGGFGDGKGLCFGDVVCCVKPVKCGEFSVLNNTILANPGFPSKTNLVGPCDVKLIKSIGISHIKLLIEDLELAPPNEDGRCVKSYIVIEGSGVAPEFKLGKICGLNSKSHIYIPTVFELGDVIIKIVLDENLVFPSRWLIRAEMIEFKSPEKPPTGCVQYFRESSGILTSFNFDVNNGTGLGNIDGLNYDICIAADGGCRLELGELFFDLGGMKNLELIPNKLARFAEFLRPVARPNARPMYRPVYLRPPTRPNYPSTQYRPANKKPSITDSYFKPAYHQSTLSAAQKYPLSQFLYKLPYSSILPAIGGARPWVVHPGYFGYNNPMTKPEMETPTDVKIESFTGGLENKLETLLNPQGVFDCTNQDVLILPTPADLSTGVHCGGVLHFGQKFVSTASSLGTFRIEVQNNGKVHGKGFALRYDVVC